jgi:hypothetical protein
MTKKPVKETPPKDRIRVIATNALIDVSEDANAPPAARAAAARTLLESIGDIGRLQSPQRQSEKPLVEMTSTELEQELGRLRSKEDELPDQEA